METKQLKKPLESSLEPSLPEKVSFIEGNVIYPLPIMPRRKTLGLEVAYDNVDNDRHLL